MSVYNGALLAKAWLSVSLASGADSGRPVLDHTVLIERHPNGVRVVATDSYMLLRAWVPEVGQEDEPEPELDEVPVATAIAIDPHRRAAGFMGYARQLAKDGEGAEVEIAVTLGVVGDESEGQLGGMESKWATFEMPGVEMVRLLTCDAVYPDWRKLGPVVAKRTAMVALGVDRLAAIAKLAKIHGEPVGWTFGGSDRPAGIEVIDSYPFVQGIVMPVRWDLERNEPRVEDAKKAERDDDAEVTPTHTPADGSEPTTVKTTLGKISQIGDKPRRSRRKQTE